MRFQHKSLPTCHSHSIWLSIGLIGLLSLLSSFGITWVDSQDYNDDDARRDPSYGPLGGEGSYDYENPDVGDGGMHDRLNGYPEGEYATKKKKFKLFEKRRYNFTTAKTFCKNRGGRLAQVSDMDEMERVNLLLAKGTKLKEGVWIGSGTREWKERSRNMGYRDRPNLRDRQGMMGGDHFGMCPSVKIPKNAVEGDACFKRMSFICEFWIDKSTPPPTSPTSTPIHERTKKEEMRRKREISGMDDEVDGI